MQGKIRRKIEPNWDTPRTGITDLAIFAIPTDHHAAFAILHSDGNRVFVALKDYIEIFDGALGGYYGARVNHSALSSLLAEAGFGRDAQRLAGGGEERAGFGFAFALFVFGVAVRHDAGARLDVEDAVLEDAGA